jgi:hypothetical protein
LAVAAIGGVCSAVNPLYTPGIIIYKNNLWNIS